MQSREKLWQEVERLFPLGPHSIHGPGHWRLVERNGLLIAQENGANARVVQLFALFHDSQRLNDGSDLRHGARGAELAQRFGCEALGIGDAEMALLVEACRNHTSGMHHADPTIGACWDADRLDLGRVGVIPDERFMSTEAGRRIARGGLVSPYLRKP